jgi:asparagine synthase (glutamine-hydrolysing)
MSDASRECVIVFNGEVYNFRELRTELAAQGYSFRSQSDTEVLLQLYRSLGEAMLPRLNGIFAFAIYDKADHKLFLACDEMGVKPLYVHEGQQGFAFASELKAILAANVPREVDVATIFRTLGFLSCPGGTTPLRGVRRMAPGEALSVKAGRIARRWIWATPSWGSQSAPLAPDRSIVDVREAVRTAVRRQMVADVPVGAFLSGGLDSSSIVAMASEIAPNIQCFTINSGSRQDPGFVDDLPYARLVAKHLRVRLHEVQVNSSQLSADLERMVYQLDEPLADPAPLNVLYISELARQAGIKVLLSGAGADDVFSGYRRHRALAMERYWQGLPTGVRGGLRRITTKLRRDRLWGRRIAKSFARADASPDSRLTGYFLWADSDRIRTLFAPDHQKALVNEDLESPFREYLASLPEGLPPLHRMLALEQRFFLADHNLLYTDKMGMAAGVEVRVPFLDKELVRLANGLAPELKQRGNEGKWILKRAMEPFLPAQVIDRPKTGFGVPLRRWLRGELKELVSDTLSPEALRRRGLFEPSAVADLIADDRAGRIDASYTILSLMCVEIWCRHFLSAATTDMSAASALTISA